MHCPTYWDEEGIRHHHNTNIVTRGFVCSKERKWVTKSKARCPAKGCDFGGDEEVRHL